MDIDSDDEIRDLRQLNSVLESDAEEENEAHDLEQLTAVLESDKCSLSESVVHGSASTASTSYSLSNNEECSKIEAALALNKVTDEKLQRLEKILILRISECRRKLSEIQGFSPAIDKQETFRYINCGKPYFKDKNNFPAPDNKDTKLMAKSQMYDFSNVTSVPGWTVKDKSDFVSLLHTMSREIKKKELHSKISQLRRDAKIKDNKEIDKHIKAISKEIETINKLPLKTIALPIDQEYDWDTIQNKLNRRHSAQEYQALWKLFLHPSINKNSWSKKEHLALQEIAHKYNLQNWDEIAKELNTGRTGYQCFVYFRTNMSNTFTGRKWTKEEEEYLKRIIDYYREDNYIPWGKVAASMENRTKIQIYNKYARLNEQRKGRFLPEEDAVILTCVENFGLNYKRIIKYLPGRSVTQLRVRYHVLANKRISAVWTVEEDRKLVQLMANQDSLTNYSSLTKHFIGKNREHIRSRYLTLLKWMKRHPNKDIMLAPRRSARRLGHGQASDNLNKALEKLRLRMQSEVDSKSYRKVTRNSPDHVIEDAIIATLVNESIEEQKEREKMMMEEEQLIVMKDDTLITTQSLNVVNLQKVLIMLKANLNKHLFKQSIYANQCPGLSDLTKDACLVKVKCYSKKDSVRTVKLQGFPDIWGHSRSEFWEYLFPPHYATITGCRKLMAYVSANRPAGTFTTLLRKNCLLKEQIHRLMERFNCLFLWPMLLSNHAPVVHKTDIAPTTANNRSQKFNLEKASIDIVYGVIIPNDQKPDVEDTENIDLLEEINQKDDVTLDSTKIIPGFLYDL